MLLQADTLAEHESAAGLALLHTLQKACRGNIGQMLLQSERANRKRGIQLLLQAICMQLAAVAGFNVESCMQKQCCS
jgi:hypothetical protein